MSGIYLLPNLITTAALYCGIMSIMSSLKGHDLQRAAYYILLATVFDFLDGYVARASKTCSSFGMEYDSLSDVIAFGVAPASLFYSSFLINLKRIGVGAVFIFVACAALRLARFNSKIEGEEKVAFRGLPTTAAAAFLSSFFLILNRFQLDWLYSLIPMIMIIISFLMVSSLKYPAVSGIQIWKKKPFFYLGLVIIIIGLIFFFKELSIFVISSAYVSVGLYERIKNFQFMKRWKVRSEEKGSRDSSLSEKAFDEDLETEGE